MILAVVLLCGIALAVPLWALAVARLEDRRRMRALEERLARLEHQSAAEGAGLAAVPPPAATPPAPAPAPIPIATATPAAWPAPGAAAAVPPVARERSLEHLVGGIWLQNAGAVLLLLGSFFLILWGYTTGRFGPGVLVAAGVALGLALAWRGDRAARRLPAFGHALIGVGLGVIYLTFHLGHFTLHALGAGLAFALLALVSVGAVATGLRYRSEAVAALGVIGAFLPPILAAWIPLHGFDLAPAPRLAYLALVDAVVFVFAARAGWSRLALAALLLTTLTWSAAYPHLRWGWPEQAGLCALFAGLGLAVVPALARSRERVPGATLAVVMLAPLGFLAVSWPFLAYAAPLLAGALLLAMALAWLLAAMWVEPRRGDESLWRALTGASVLFVSAALERAVGLERTAMAWCLEALVLMALGLRGRPWLRACGHAVGIAGGLGLFFRLPMDRDWSNDMLPVLYPGGLTTIVCLAALIGIAVLLGRHRARLGETERVAARVWTAGANVLVIMWTALESGHVARALHGTGGRWAQLPDITALPPARQTIMLAAVLTSVAWLAQAAVLLALGWRQADAYLRWLGLVLFGVTVLKFLFFDLATVDVFWRFLVAIVVGAALLVVSYLYQRRARARDTQDGTPPPAQEPPSQPGA